MNRAITKDGIPIQVGGNAGSAKDILGARTNGAEFIGLFRSEFLFQNFAEEPDEDQQLAAYREALAPSAGSFPVTVRLLDIGGDKPLKFLSQPKEANPFLGVRGIRLLMANPRFFAVSSAGYFTVGSFVSGSTPDPDGHRLVRNSRDEKNARRNRRRTDKRKRASPMADPRRRHDRDAVGRVLIDQLLPHLDFISIGTNDLTQYILCAERGSASLSAFSDSLHPAVLRICEQVIRAAQEHGIKVSICGEIASDPEALPIWLALGLRDFSVTAAEIPATKSLIRKLTISGIAARLASERLSFLGPLEVRKFSRSFIL